MTKQEILDHFKDIDFVYNDSSKHETLSRMIDELLKEQENRLEIASEIAKGSVLMYQGKELVRCKDCKHYYKGHCQSDDTIYWCRQPDWFCADGERGTGDV